jgi:hypothetical protein
MFIFLLAFAATDGVLLFTLRLAFKASGIYSITKIVY